MDVSATTARRYLLGRQGLWPGRRWAGRRGTARALQAMELLQMDPLDIVSARGRAKPWFDFDYVWEKYKPASKRRWGYHVLPIMWGDRLVGRLDPRLDRATGTLVIEGFWLEARETGRDAAFAAALARGLASLARSIEAKRVDVAAVRPPRLRAYLKTELKTAL